MFQVTKLSGLTLLLISVLVFYYFCCYLLKRALSIGFQYGCTFNSFNGSSKRHLIMYLLFGDNFSYR